MMYYQVLLKWLFPHLRHLHTEVQNEFVFVVIDKNTHQIAVVDCSADFYESGKDKVKRAVEAYDLFYKTDGFDPSQYFINLTL